VNLPISIYGPLLERGVVSRSTDRICPVLNVLQRPQHLAVHLSLVQNNGPKQDSNGRTEAYVGWTGMASASSLAHFNAAHSGDGGFETVEIDPQFAQGLGFAQGDVVCDIIMFFSHSLNAFQVEIGLLYDLPQAKSVGTEPLTSDDWEIIVGGEHLCIL
jgi:peroxin-1